MRDVCTACGEVQTHKVGCPEHDLQAAKGRFWNHKRILYRQGEMITGFEAEPWAIDAVCELNRLDEIAGAEYTNKVLWDILHYHFKREADA